MADPQRLHTDLRAIVGGTNGLVEGDTRSYVVDFRDVLHLIAPAVLRPAQ